MPILLNYGMSCFVLAAVFIKKPKHGQLLALNIFRYSENNFLGRQYGGLVEKINLYFMKKTVRTDLYRFFLSLFRNRNIKFALRLA